MKITIIQAKKKMQYFYECANCQQIIGLTSSVGKSGYGYKGSKLHKDNISCPFCDGNLIKIEE